MLDTAELTRDILINEILVIKPASMISGLVGVFSSRFVRFDLVLPKMFSHQRPVICEVSTYPNQLFVPKLSLVPQKDGSIASPPLEDLSPLLSRSELEENMLIGIHLKSKEL